MKTVITLLLLITSFSLQAQDTLLRYHDISAGLAYAKQKGKYAVIYYEPDNCKTCRIPASELFENLASSRSYFNAKEFNNNYVLIMARASDTAFLKKTGIPQFPSFAIFTGDKQFMYYSYDKPLYIALRELSQGYFNTLLRIHYLNTYEPQAIRQSGFKADLLKGYLETYLANESDMKDLSKGQAAYKESLAWYHASLTPHDKAPLHIVPRRRDTLIAKIVKAKSPPPKEGKAEELDKTITEEEKPTPGPDTMPHSDPDGIEYGIAAPISAPDTTFSLFNFNADTTFIMEALDSLMVKYSKADSAIAELDIQVSGTIDHADGCLYEGGQSIASDGHTFKPRASFDYLVRNFKILHKYRFNKYYDHDYVITLYEFISRRLNRFISLNADGSNPAERAYMLAYHRQFANATAELQHLEKPLFLINVLDYGGAEQQIDTLVKAEALPYLDGLLSAKPNIDAFIAALSKKLDKYFSRETNYVVFTYDDPGYQNGYAYYYPEYLKNSFSFLFSRIAWHYYGQENKDSISKDRIARYARASLKLAPNDPFALEINSQLAYDKGDRQTALKHAEKAVAEGREMLGWSRRITSEQVDILKEKVVKIKEGKL